MALRSMPCTPPIRLWPTATTTGYPIPRNSRWPATKLQPHQQPTYLGYIPVSKSFTSPSRWEWNIENVQFVWDHGAGSFAPNIWNEDQLFSFAAKKSAIHRLAHLWHGIPLCQWRRLLTCSTPKSPAHSVIQDNPPPPFGNRTTAIRQSI